MVSVEDEVGCGGGVVSVSVTRAKEHRVEEALPSKEWAGHKEW